MQTLNKIAFDLIFYRIALKEICKNNIIFRYYPSISNNFVTYNFLFVHENTVHKLRQF